MDGKEDRDAVKARPRRGREGKERFDTEVVSYSSDAESTGLQGK